MTEMKNYLFSGIKFCLARMGYRLQPLDADRPIALPTFDGDPRALRYLKNGRDCLITGKMENGRGLLLFSLGANGKHPFVEGVRRVLDASGESISDKEVLRRTLHDFYSRHRPQSVAEVLGISTGKLPGFDDQPPWAVIKPWESLTLEERLRKMRVTERVDNRQVSNVEMGIEHGCNFCGPVSDEKLKVEVERLYRIMQSIRRHGFVRNDFPDGDIRVDILVEAPGDWRWLVKSGHHRAAVMSALGFTTVPIRVDSIVCREEADVWPQVMAGTYSRHLALKVFDNIFSGVGGSILGKCKEKVMMVPDG